MRGFVVGSPGRFRIDRHQRFDSLIIDEIILQELIGFLERYYSAERAGHLLDLGAGLKPYLPVYADYFSSTTAIDFTRSAEVTDLLDVYASAESLPFAEDSFDCILCTEVLEHVPNPQQALRECRRVLKPNGRLFLTTPFLHPLHEEPYDFYRYTPYAYRHMGEQAGLELEYIQEKGGAGAFLLLLTLHLLLLAGLKLEKSLGWRLFNRHKLLLYPLFIWPQLLWLHRWNRRRRPVPPDAEVCGIRGTFSRLSLGYVGVYRKSSDESPSMGR